MVAKIWKKICFFILIFACLFNITTKLVNKLPFLEELRTSAEYMVEQNEAKNEI